MTKMELELEMPGPELVLSLLGSKRWVPVLSPALAFFPD